MERGVDGKQCFAVGPEPSNVDPSMKLRSPRVVSGHGGLRASCSFDGQRLDNTFVVEHRGAGWLVFYWERGTKRDFVKHASEAAVCQDVWRHFTITAR